MLVSPYLEEFYCWAFQDSGIPVQC